MILRNGCFFLICLFVSLTSGIAAEEILDFASHITVQENGDLIVEETIQVRAEGDQIKRGIYRDFPTLYRGWMGLRVEVPFEVQSVKRNGSEENWHTNRRANGVRLYIGSEDVPLRPGIVTYTIRYRTAQQLGFFEDYDELYWNVTGNGWAFPILQASACVELPPGAAVQKAIAFTGRSGSQESNFRTGAKSGCDVFLQTTQALSPGEGFTIAVTWPPGYVTPPGRLDAFLRLILSNIGLFFGVIGLVAVGGYFLIMWIAFGRDPQRGIIIPLYAPPEGMTPQDVRYLNHMGRCDNRSFAAAVIYLAVQGALTIKELRSDGFTLVKKEGHSLQGDDLAFFNKLFEDGSPLDLKPRNHQTMTAARATMKRIVTTKARHFFTSNTALWVVGLILTLIPLGISLLSAQEPETAIFMLIWMSIWSLGCAGLSNAVLQALRGSQKWKAVPLILFTIPFLLGWCFGLWMLLNSASIWVCLIYVCGIAMCVLFQHLLKRPSVEGQQLRDQIQGFRQYLTVAEADRLNLENPPDRTPELFEKFLPYALALNVEQAWAEQFSNVLDATSLQPEWYQSTSIHGFAAGTMASTMGSTFSSAISSASTAPGSSSGSSSGGGGGSSGGGGGGGGGGGW